MANAKKIVPDQFTRIDNDVNGNPRYVLHFLHLLTQAEREAKYSTHGGRYALAVARGNDAGGRKYHNRSYGGGVVFQSYSVPELCAHLNDMMQKRERIENAGAVAEITTGKGVTAGFIIGTDDKGYYGAMRGPRTNILPRKSSFFATVGACARAVRAAGYHV